MEAINQLEHSYFLLKSGGGDYHECIQWAVDRLRGTKKATTKKSSCWPHPRRVPKCWRSPNTWSNVTAATRRWTRSSPPASTSSPCVTTTCGTSRRCARSSRSWSSLYERLGYPGWLAVLCRNCRYAKEGPQYREYFEKEFAYLARLWAVASSRAHFESRYNRAISAQHDAL